MSKIKIAYINILETGTVTVTNEAADFPKYRLYDRRFKRLFKGTSAVDFTISIDQGAIGASVVNCLIIPAGHNLDGAYLYWEYSFDGSTYYSFYNLTVFGAEMIYLYQTNSSPKRYLRLRLTGLSAPPEIGEVIMSQLYEIDATPEYGLQAGQQKNVSRIESPSGDTSYMKQGEPREMRSYTLNRITAAERAVMEDWDATWQGTKPFFLIDHNGDMMFAELQNDMIFTEDSNGHFSCDLGFLEVL